MASENMEIEGTVKHISEIEVFGQKQTQKRFLVLEVVDGDYTNVHGFQVFNDKCAMFDSVNIGDTVTVHYNLGTVREWQSKWFADMNRAWKIDSVAAAAPPPAVNSAGESEEGDDIPF